MAPFDVSSLGGIGSALVFGAIGFGFGAVLEMTGFGDTRKLAGQFYFKEVTVLQTMFTAIAVAAVLIAGASAFGLLDLSRVWVNPTYLWPGIVGGLVMGVGFIIGGFCPGTSLVAAATLKIDGIFFLLGAFLGVYLFGATVGSFEPFFVSSYMGRFTLSEWLGISDGAAVLLVLALALLMFWGGELLQARYGQGRPWAEIPLLPQNGWKVSGAAVLVVIALGVAARGQPTLEQRWTRLAPAVRDAVDQRAVFAHPAEVVALRKDLSVQAVVLDLRSEHDFNLFHVGGARRVDPEALVRPEGVKPLLDQGANTVTFLMGNGEQAALAAYRKLRAAGVQNLYVVEGGVNRWLELYAVPECVARRAEPTDPDALGWRFSYATGSVEPAAWPELSASRAFGSPCQDPVSTPIAPEHGASGGPGRGHGITWPAYAFTKRVKLQTKAAVKGGCG